MWSGAFTSFVIFVLLGSEDAVSYRVVAIPFLLSTLFDVDDLQNLGDHNLNSGVHFFNVHALDFIVSLALWSRLCRIVSLLIARPCLVWAFSVLSAWPMYACNGAIIHFALQLFMRTHSIPLCMGYTAASSVLLLCEYRFLLQHDTDWQPMHLSIVAGCLLLNAGMLAWLMLFWGCSLATFWATLVNSLAPLAYVAVVARCVFSRPSKKTSNDAVSETRIELNPLVRPPTSKSDAVCVI